MFDNQLRRNKYEAIEYNMASLSETFNKVTNNNFQVLIGVSGITGVGKTTFAIKLSKKGDPNFSVKRNVLINPSFAEVVKKVTELPYGAYVVLDEAINICYKMEWYSNTVKAFGKFINKCRKERKKIIFCIPNFSDISKNIRQNINLWVQILARGRGLFLTKSPFFMASERWDLSRMERNLRNFIKKRYVDVTVDEILELFRKDPHYAGEISYTAMSDELEAEYEILRDKEKYSDLIDLKNAGDGSRNEKIRMLRYSLWRMGLSHRQIGKIEGVSNASISVTLKNLRNDIKERIDNYLKEIGYYAKFRFKADGSYNQAVNIQYHNNQKSGEINGKK